MQMVLQIIVTVTPFLLELTTGIIQFLSYNISLLLGQVIIQPVIYHSNSICLMAGCKISFLIIIPCRPLRIRRTCYSIINTSFLICLIAGKKICPQQMSCLISYTSHPHGVVIFIIRIIFILRRSTSLQSLCK